MSIAIECHACGAAFQVGDGVAGKRVRCRHCQAVIDVPHPEEALELVASVVVDEPPPPPAATDVQPRPRPQVSAPLPDLSAASLLYPQTTGTPYYWGGVQAHAGGGYRSLSRDPSLAALLAFGLLWGGFTICQSMDECRDLWGDLRFDRAMIWLPGIICLLILMTQTACLGMIVVGMTGMARRRSWGAAFGFVAAAAVTGLAFAWTPMLSELAHLGNFLYAVSDLPVRTVVRHGFRLLVETTAYLIVPAMLVFAFRGRIDSSIRGEQPPALALVVAAVTLGWSVHGLIKVLMQLAAYYSLMEMAGTLGNLNARFWIIVALRMGCFAAVATLAAAGIGMFLRQTWSNMTALIASSAYLLLELGVLATEIMPRGDTMPVGWGGHALRGVVPLLFPAIVCGLSIFSKDEE